MCDTIRTMPEFPKGCYGRKDMKKMAAEKKSTNKTTTKTAAAKKAAAKKPSVKKTAAAKKPASKAESKPNKLTRVIAKFDAGWGNALFIRGVGAGLDWQKGVAMQSIGPDEWLWEQLVPNGSVCFKVLVNDEIWATGEDCSVLAGDTIICHPQF